jgi:hypothetical protein
MLSKDQLQIVEKKLAACDNVQEAFDMLGQTFDLKQTKISGFIVGPKFREGMIKAIQLLNPPLKR